MIENPSGAELEVRRYEARLSFWKVVLGTFIVGLAGVLIPGAVNFYNIYFENIRKETEIKLSQQAAHQQYIKDFFTTAINQDIELRIHFADYFAFLSGPDQEQSWRSYLEDMKKLRDENRNKINSFEKQLVDFKKQLPNQIDNAEFDRINRELAWPTRKSDTFPRSEARFFLLEKEASLVRSRAYTGKRTILFKG